MPQVDQLELYLSSVPLVRIGADSLPSGHASGCLIDYGGKRLLLTVAHATADNQRWALQVGFDQALQQTQLFGLGAIRFLASGTLSASHLERVDFSYVQVPSTTVAFRQGIEIPSNVIKAERPIKVHTPTFEELPDTADRYGFCGLVLPAREEHFGTTYASGEFRIYENLAFLRPEGDKLVFMLPSKHSGHDQFEGCSGAPILNSAGVPIALVASGCKDTDEIYGLSLATYKMALDIEVGLL
jgi:hypothetical protein